MLKQRILKSEKNGTKDVSLRRLYNSLLQGGDSSDESEYELSDDELEGSSGSSSKKKSKKKKKKKKKKKNKKKKKKPKVAEVVLSKAQHQKNADKRFYLKIQNLPKSVTRRKNGTLRLIFSEGFQYFEYLPKYFKEEWKNKSDEIDTLFDNGSPKRALKKYFTDNPPIDPENFELEFGQFLQEYKRRTLQKKLSLGKRDATNMDIQNQGNRTLQERAIKSMANYILSKIVVKLC